MVNFIVQLGLLIVSAIIQAALAPKPPKPTPGTLEDFDVPIAEEGIEVPVVFGTVWLRGPNILWYGDMRTSAVKSKSGK